MKDILKKPVIAIVLIVVVVLGAIIILRYSITSSGPGSNNGPKVLVPGGSDNIYVNNTGTSTPVNSTVGNVVNSSNPFNVDVNPFQGYKNPFSK